jgi:orotidine-5'-phosphate decarboxylase
VRRAAELIVALDVPDLAAADAALGRLGTEVRFFKVGLELFAGAGPQAVERVRTAGARVFLDLKVGDIPHTARGAVQSAARLGVDLFTVHALGGPRMIAAAREASEAAGGPRILAVTLLTSLEAGDLTILGLAGSVEEAVLRLSRMAVSAGAHGLVASPREVAALRAALGEEVLLVIPGVRPAGSDAGDQKRTMSPGDAVRAGADYLVVGRPVTGAPDPAAAARAILAEMRV